MPDGRTLYEWIAEECDVAAADHDCSHYFGDIKRFPFGEAEYRVVNGRMMTRAHYMSGTNHPHVSGKYRVFQCEFTIDRREKNAIT